MIEVEDRTQEESTIEAIGRLLSQLSEDLGDRECGLSSLAIIITTNEETPLVCYRGTGSRRAQMVAIKAIAAMDQAKIERAEGLKS
jgi:hypothetical protein